jgi:hypothetical protein
VNGVYDVGGLVFCKVDKKSMAQTITQKTKRKAKERPTYT